MLMMVWLRTSWKCSNHFCHGCHLGKSVGQGASTGGKTMLKWAQGVVLMFFLARQCLVLWEFWQTFEKCKNEALGKMSEAKVFFLLWGCYLCFIVDRKWWMDVETTKCQAQVLRCFGLSFGKRCKVCFWESENQRFSTVWWWLAVFHGRKMVRKHCVKQGRVWFLLEVWNDSVIASERDFLESERTNASCCEMAVSCVSTWWMDNESTVQGLVTLMFLTEF